MFVPVEYRGMGVAKALCLEALAAAKELRFRTARLTTGEKQPEARGLYKKLGFQVVSPWEDNPPGSFDYFENELQ